MARDGEKKTAVGGEVGFGLSGGGGLRQEHARRLNLDSTYVRTSVVSFAPDLEQPSVRLPHFRWGRCIACALRGTCRTAIGSQATTAVQRGRHVRSFRDKICNPMAHVSCLSRQKQVFTCFYFGLGPPREDWTKHTASVREKKRVNSKAWRRNPLVHQPPFPREDTRQSNYHTTTNFWPCRD